MAINKFNIISIVITVTILMAGGLPGGVEAQSPASAPIPEIDPCMTALLNMSDCLSFVATGSNDTKPSKDCCPELAGLVDSNPICLCHLLGGPDKIGLDLSIDTKRALQLPSLCKVETPPVSTCAALGIPVAAPVGSPTPSSPEDSMASPPSLLPGDIAPGVAPASPSTTATLSGGSNLRITSLQCFVGLAFMIFSTIV